MFKSSLARTIIIVVVVWGLVLGVSIFLNFYVDISISKWVFWAFIALVPVVGILAGVAQITTSIASKARQINDQTTVSADSKTAQQGDEYLGRFVNFTGDTPTLTIQIPIQIEKYFKQKISELHQQIKEQRIEISDTKNENIELQAKHQQVQSELTTLRSNQIETLAHVIDIHIENKNWQKSLEVLESIEKIHSDAFIINFRGILRAKMEQYELAKADFQEAIRQDATLANAYFNLGVTLDRLEETHKIVIDMYTRAIEIKSDYAEAYTNRGILYARDGNIQLALQNFEMAINCQDKPYALPFISHSKALTIIKDFEGAMVSAQRAIDIEPNNPDGYVQRASANLSLGELTQAIIDASKALKIDSEHIEAYNIRATGLAFSGDLEKALSDYDNALKINSEYTEALGNRANVLSRIGRFDEAIHDYTTAIKNDPNMVNAYIGRANVFNVLYRYQDAITDLNKAIELDPNIGTVYVNRANSWMMLRQFEKALDDLNTAFNFHPSHPYISLQRSKALLELGKFQEARDVANLAIQLNPNNAEAYKNRAKILFFMKLPNEAIADCNKAIELVPSEEYYLQRAMIWQMMGRFDKALADCTTVIEKFESDRLYVAYGMRSRTYSMMGKHLEALTDLDKAIELNSNDATLYEWRGSLKQKLAKIEEAKKDYQKFQELKNKPRNRDVNYSIGFYNPGTDELT